jgi:hypothetical protein
VIGGVEEGEGVTFVLPPGGCPQGVDRLVSMSLRYAIIGIGTGAAVAIVRLRCSGTCSSSNSSSSHSSSSTAVTAVSAVAAVTADAAVLVLAVAAGESIMIAAAHVLMIAVTADLVALSERGLQTATGAVTAALAVDAHERVN